jgi:hypothetical protein
MKGDWLVFVVGELPDGSDFIVKDVVKVDLLTPSRAIQFQQTRTIVRMKNGPRNDPISHIVHVRRLLAFRRALLALH